MLRRIVKTQQLDIFISERLKRFDFKFCNRCLIANCIIWKLACRTPSFCLLEIGGCIFGPRIFTIRTINDARCDFLLLQISSILNYQQTPKWFLDTYRIANMIIGTIIMRERKASQDFLVPQVEIS